MVSPRDIHSICLFEMVSVRDILMSVRDIGVSVCDGFCEGYPYVCVRWCLCKISYFCVSVCAGYPICLCVMVSVRDIHMSV
jgi:hypothetical protein